jgi:hypothetical protein
MKVSYLYLASHLLWATVSLGAGGFADRCADQTPKQRAQRDLLFLYGVMATVGDEARFVVQTLAFDKYAEWEIARVAWWNTVWRLTRDAVGYEGRNVAQNAARIAAGEVAVEAIWVRADLPVPSLPSGLKWMRPDLLSVKVARTEWQSALRQKQIMMQAFSRRLAHISFVDPEVVDWSAVNQLLQAVMTTDAFQRTLPEVQVFFTLVTQRIAYLTEGDADKSAYLWVQYLGHPLVSEYVAVRRRALSVYLPEVLADVVLFYEDHPTFQDILSMLESRLPSPGTLSYGTEDDLIGSAEGKQREGRGAPTKDPCCTIL